MTVPRHWMALLRLSMTHALRRPLQSGLLVAGVALGVAVGAAIDLANSSALSAFTLSTEAVSGRATHRIEGGPRGIDEALYARLRVDHGVRSIAPIVQGVVGVEELGRETFVLLGVDPFAEAPFREFVAAGGSGGDVLGPLLVTPGAVALSSAVSSRYGVAPGALLHVDVGPRVVTATLVGLLEPADGLGRRALDNLVIADVATAQELLGKVGRLDRIDVLAPPEPGLTESFVSEVEALLPAGASVVPSGEEHQTVASMTDAFRLNLTALSLMALLVGMFLIFNTVRFSIVQRRRTLATLRMLGVTRREVFGMILAEAMILGIVGSALGLVLGVGLGRAAVAVVTETVNDLFFTATVRGVEVRSLSLVRGMVLGTGAAVVAALLPAYEATSVPPVAALRRADVERAARRAVPPSLATGAAVGGVGLIALAVPGGRVDLGFVGLAGIVLAFAFAAPAVTLGAMAVARPVTRRSMGVVGRMAPRDVTRSLSRTAVAVAALAIAVSVSIGVQVMVDSFRATVVDWLEVTFQADVFVSPRVVAATAERGTLDPAVVERLAGMPETASLSTAREARVRSPVHGAVDVLAVRHDIAGADRRYADSVGDPAETWRAVADGGVVVSEPMARLRGLRVGGVLVLETDVGQREFPVAGVFYDYAVNNGIALMDDAVYRAAWRDDGVTSVAVRLVPGADPDSVARRLRSELPPGVEVRSTRGLRAEVLEVFDRAFAITGALRVLAIFVAFMGVLSALMALQLERRREYATLRATGMTPRQLGALSALEAGLVGATAGILSWPAGLCLALVLIHVINRRSFGWTIDTQLSATPFVLALALSVAAALLAGAYPAVRLGRLPIARSLREE